MIVGNRESKQFYTNVKPEKYYKNTDILIVFSNVFQWDIFLIVWPFFSLYIQMSQNCFTKKAQWSLLHPFIAAPTSQVNLYDGIHSTPQYHKVDIPTLTSTLIKRNQSLSKKRAIGIRWNQAYLTNKWIYPRTTSGLMVYS